MTQGRGPQTLGDMPILVADVGGTNARFQLLDVDGMGTPRGVDQRTLPSGDFASLGDATRAFLADRPPPGRACFALAGPVVEGRCRATNLPWRVDEEELAEDLGVRHVRVVNDFYAVARGIEALTPDDARELQAGAASADGPRLIVGAGTGLGVAVLLPGAPPRVLPSEGGHTSFAPRDEREDALLRFLRERHGRASVERVVSGPGLAAIYDFLSESGRIAPCPELRVADPDGPSRIASAAAKDPGAAVALELFVSLYGAAVGDLALSVLPTGGLVLAGGIAPKILRGDLEARFLEAFADKGRMRPLLEGARVTLVQADDVGLRGAVRACLEMGSARGQ